MVDAKRQRKRPRKTDDRTNSQKVSGSAIGASVDYEREMAIDEFGSPSKTARDRWDRARRRQGRPRHEPVEIYSPERKAELLLANATSREDGRAAEKEVGSSASIRRSSARAGANVDVRR
jgi:hypothetical protein